MSAVDTDNETITVEIYFPYFKQGDDFDACQGDLEQFVAFHQNVIQRTQEMLNLISEDQRQNVRGGGDTHACWLTGPKEIMDRLVAHDLATHIERDSDEEEFSDHELSDEKDEQEGEQEN